MQYRSYSFIKPNLFNLTSSGTMFSNIIIERNREQLSVEVPQRTAIMKHIIVLHCGVSAALERKIDGCVKSSLFSEGDIIINPSGFFANPRWSSNVEILLLAIEPGFLNGIAKEIGKNDKVDLVPRFQFRDALLQQLIYALVSEFEQGEKPDRIYLESLAYTLAIHLIKKYSLCKEYGSIIEQKTGFSPRKLSSIIEYINDNLGDPLSLEDIAKQVGLSASYFTILFKRSTGMAPHQYVIKKRVEKARFLLSQTHMPLVDIANLIGFSDQSHLTRQIRRYTGMTPKEFRNF